MEPGRRDADHAVTDARRRPVDEPVAVHDAHAEPGQVEGVRLHQPRMLGGLAAHERGTRLGTAVRDAADEVRDPLRMDLADREVVQEQPRPGAVAHDVVRAHRDQVAADGVQATHLARDLRLGAHAVRGTHQDRARVARRQLQRGAEAAEATEQVHAGRARGADPVAHQLHGTIAGGHVHAGRGVRRAGRRQASVAPVRVVRPRASASSSISPCSADREASGRSVGRRGRARGTDQLASGLDQHGKC